ncbi:hypothetical protein [Actinomadura sp. B10D3]|uniref:hypothetical protein n=1 Tax=Actinomadura sp. B10D3 TaxID=3153557 RepID=UPI00325C3BD6
MRIWPTPSKNTSSASCMAANMIAKVGSLTTPIATWDSPEERCLRTRITTAASRPPSRLQDLPEQQHRQVRRQRGHQAAGRDRRHEPDHHPLAAVAVTEDAPDRREDRTSDEHRDAQQRPWTGLIDSSRCSSGSVGTTTDSRVPLAATSSPRARGSGK